MVFISSFAFAQSDIMSDEVKKKSANKDKQYIAITYNGKELLGTKKLRPTGNDKKGYFKSFLLETFVDSIKSQIRSEITDSISAISGFATYDSTATLINEAVPELVYMGLLTQSGTDAPTVTVLHNSLGGTVVWTRSGVGFYRGTLAGAFDENSTIVGGFNNFSFGGQTQTGIFSSPDVVYLKSTASDGTVADDMLDKTPVLIYTY